MRGLVIERGLGHYIAVVYRGEDRGELADRVREPSRQIGEEFGEVPAEWEGELDRLKVFP